MGRVAQSVGHLTRKSEVLDSIPGLATYFGFSFRWFKKGSCQLLAKYVHEVLVNRLGGLSLPRISDVWLTDRPNMALDVYSGRKTTAQQQQQLYGKNNCTSSGVSVGVDSGVGVCIGLGNMLKFYIILFFLWWARHCQLSFPECWQFLFNFNSFIPYC